MTKYKYKIVVLGPKIEPKTEYYSAKENGPDTEYIRFWKTS